MKWNTSPLISFVGTTPNIGTTIASFATAYRIAEQSEAPILFLCLNLKSAKLHRYIGVDRPAVTLDSLRPELRAGTLTGDKLFRASYRMPDCPRLHVLFGNLMRDQAEFFAPEELEHLFVTAKQVFRLSVADVNAYWDNAATVAALRRADTRILTTTSALSSFQEDGQRWIGQVSPLFGIPSNAYEAVIIHPPWRNGGFSLRDIRKEIGLPIIGDLRMTEAMLTQLDSGRLEEWLKEDQHGKLAMRKTSDQLMTKHVITRKAGISVQPWYRKLLAHRNGVGS
ncbi:hypothetical protein [Paenibacillus abyssi]|uniref:Uncharacterized protein n=1 Tax=Paenibacillus abyssi TaxID=1340531 RepID=A0A917FWQ1_9BACL|nr:hypothetical protein [Paenibacillus abyssi]GGG09166.1 hypothetical protein GCM10010916_27510 [Paenibacillus abyssi]